MAISSQRRSELLAAFNVTAYRSRDALNDGDVAPQDVFNIEEVDLHAMALSHSSDALHTSNDANTTPATDAEKRVAVDAVKDLQALVGVLDSSAEQESLSSSHSEESLHEAQNSPAEDLDNTRKFERLSWRFGNVLVVETTAFGEDDVSDAQVKTAFVNNVFRVLLGKGFRYAHGHAQRWPDELAGASVSDSAAQTWLQLFFDGQRVADPDTKLWLMGNDVLDILLKEHGAPSDLEGMRIHDSRLQMDVYVTPSLDSILERPYLKAGVWQLLRELSAE